MPKVPEILLRVEALLEKNFVPLGIESPYPLKITLPRRREVKYHPNDLLKKITNECKGKSESGLRAIQNNYFHNIIAERFINDFERYQLESRQFPRVLIAPMNEPLLNDGEITPEEERQVNFYYQWRLKNGVYLSSMIKELEAPDTDLPRYNRFEYTNYYFHLLADIRILKILSGEDYPKINIDGQEMEKTDNAQTQPTSPKRFEDLFNDPQDVNSTFEAMRKCGIINDANMWIYGRKKAAIVAVIDVLLERVKLQEVSRVAAAKLLAEKVGISISERAVRSNTHRRDDLIAQFKALIK